MGPALTKIAVAFLDILQTVVLAAAFAMFIYLFVLQPHQVKGQSMENTFHDGEYVLTNKLSYRFGEPKHGDVVIIKAPPKEWCAERNCEYIKRIIGMGGDRVLLKEGEVYLNNQLIDDSFTKDSTTSGGEYLREGVEVTISDGQFLVMGDNRLHSRDGRNFEPVKKSLIIGKVWVRYFPFNRSGLIPEQKLY